jgi:hypothetical protein
MDRRASRDAASNWVAKVHLSLTPLLKPSTFGRRFQTLSRL